MRLRCIIVDDEDTGANTLKFLIENYTSDLKVVACTTNAGKAIELIEDYKPEIVFLDISMPEMDGFELLNRLEWRNFNLIFTTAHQEHGLKAIKQDAVDYLLKPIDYNEIIRAVEKVRSRYESEPGYISSLDYVTLNELNRPPSSKLAVNSKHSVESIDPSDIISLESRSNYTLVRLNSGNDILSPRTLGEFDVQLCKENSNFMRVHHSFVINLKNVVRYMKDSDTMVMSNNQKIPLARSKKTVFLKWLNA